MHEEIEAELERRKLVQQGSLSSPRSFSTPSSTPRGTPRGTHRKPRPRQLMASSDLRLLEKLLLEDAYGDSALAQEEMARRDEQQRRRREEIAGSSGSA